MTRPVIGKLAFTGINKDKVPGDVALDWWTDGRNVMFVGGDTVRVPGEARFSGATLFPVSVCQYVDIGSQNFWLYASGAGVGVTDGTNHYNITPNTGPGWGAIAAKNRVLSIGVLGNVPFINHPERGPYYWDGIPANRMKPLPGWPANWLAQMMRPYKVFLLAINIDTGTGLLEDQISWSTSAPPGQIPQAWTPSPTNDAGDIRFSSPGGPLLDGIQLRDQFFVSKINYTGVLQYVGGQFVMEGRDVFPSVGVFGPNCLIEHGNLVYMYTGNGEFIRHDGSSITNLLYGVLQSTVSRAINMEFPSAVFCWRDDDNGQIGLAYPTGAQKPCNEGVTVEALTLRPGIRDLPNVSGWGWGITAITIEDWDHDSQAWNLDTTTWNETASGYRPPKIVWAGGANGMLEQGLATTQVAPDGSPRPMAAYASRLGIDFEQMDFRKTITGLVPRVRCPVGSIFSFTFGGQASDMDPITVLPPLPFVTGTDEKLDFFIDERLLSIELATTGGPTWKFAGMFPYARKSGRW